MTNEELDAATEGLQFMLDGYRDKNSWEGYPRMLRDGIAAITTLRECEARLRAQLAEALAERDAMIHPDHVDGLVKLAEPMIYEALAAETARADRAEAALAAQIEVDAEICTDIMSYDCMKADGETYQPMWVQKVAKGMVSLARQDIRNQPHDRTALDRHDAKTREKALREAADEAERTGTCLLPSGHFLSERCRDAILALVEKGKDE